MACTKTRRPSRLEPSTSRTRRPNAAHLDRWPVGKIPLLYDGSADVVVPETSIIIEYLQRHYPGPIELVPAEPDLQHEVRLWDRFFNLYVSVPMQKIVTDRTRPEGAKDPHGVEEARATLDMAYTMLDGQLGQKRYVTSERFTMADCSALPTLFFGSVVHPFKPDQSELSGYFERLLQRPSVQRVIAEDQPYFEFFPYRAAMPRRFLEAAE